MKFKGNKSRQYTKDGRFLSMARAEQSPGPDANERKNIAKRYEPQINQIQSTRSTKKNALDESELEASSTIGVTETERVSANSGREVIDRLKRSRISSSRPNLHLLVITVLAHL